MTAWDSSSALTSARIWGREKSSQTVQWKVETVLARTATNGKCRHLLDAFFLGHAGLPPDAGNVL
jgi:hypothetical protein